MTGHFNVDITSSPEAPAQARQELRRWLDSLRWPADASEDLVLAVSEAVTNSYQHAYGRGRPGPITLHAAALGAPGGARRASVTVTDRGAWRMPAPGSRNSRSGIGVMRAVAGKFQLTGDASGTQVRMISTSVRPSENMSG